jgi:hypothetical protein
MIFSREPVDMFASLQKHAELHFSLTVGNGCRMHSRIFLGGRRIHHEV